jgi:phosphoglycerate-specific signal transduction histidine kinase
VRNPPASGALEESPPYSHGEDMDEAARPASRRFSKAMNDGFRPTIGLRLIVALLAFAILGLGTAVVALWTFDRYGRAAEEIAATETRRLANVARFTEIATGLRAEMPRLVFAESEEEKQSARAKLDDYADALGILVQRLKLPRPSGHREGGKEFGEELQGDISAIDNNVSERIAIRHEVAGRVVQLRAEHAHFLREITPLLTNAAINIHAALRRLGTQSETVETASMDMVRRELMISEALSRLHAHVNLMLGKILEAAAEKRGAEIERIRTALAESVVTAAPLNVFLCDVPNTSTICAIWRGIESQVTAPPRLIDFKLREAALTEDGIMLVSRVDQSLNDLADLVARTVVGSNEVSIQAAQRAREAINRGTLLILGFAAATGALSLLVGWFYIGRRFILRLSALLRAMRGIAAGELETPVPVDGDDEVGQLADALRTLQNRSQLARERRVALAAANEQLSFEIAERRAAQAELERTQEELVQAGKLAAIGQVSAGIAHEFNQPLAAMLSYLHNAGRYLETGNSDKVAEKLEQIERLLSRLARISNHLKTLARRPSKTTERCCAGTVVERAAALFEAQIESSGTRLAIAPYCCSTLVEAEPNRLEQVIVNLLSNAFDAVDGRPGAAIAVRIANIGDTQRILIADNGPGLSAQHGKRIFDAFFTTKPPGSGLGLGLTIAFNIIQDFKGRLTIKNRRNGGAVAIVSLRIAAPASKETREELHAGR